MKGNTYSTLLLITLFGMGIRISVAQTPDLNLGIADETSYQAFKAAMHKSEYVRLDYALDPKPRVAAGTAALLVFATTNPLATDTDLQQFLDEYDAALSTFAPGDSDLVRSSNFLAAVRRMARVGAPGAYPGLDTRIGVQVLELLGVDIPVPAGFESTRQRMVAFDNARIRPFTDSPAWAQVLLLGLYGQDLAGNPNSAIAAILEAYLSAQGFEPVPDGSPDDTRFDSVTTALAGMPADFAGYQALLAGIGAGATNLDSTTLQDSIQASFVNIQAENTRLINEITADMVNPPTFKESVDNALVPALVAQVSAEYEQDVLAVAADRAMVSWNAMILLQSDQAEARNYATSANSFLDVQLNTDDSLAKVKAGIKVASGTGRYVGGLVSGNPGMVVSGLGDIVGGSLKLGELFGGSTGPPAPEEQIFNQIVQVREDIDEMRVQMHDRFDQIESQLNLIFMSMVDSFAALGNQIGDLQASVDDLSRSMAVQRATLDRLEDALWGVAQDILLHDLTLLTDLVLDYRGSGLDLPYGTSSPNFVEAASNLSTWATTTSASTTFAGPTSSPLASYDDALAILSGDSIGRNVNDLRVFPATLGLSQLFGDRVVSAAPWAQSAAAYVQLAKESPWYFAYLYENQSGAGSPPDLDRIIAKGDDLVSMMANGRDATLFDALLDGYLNTITELKAQEDAIIQTVRAETGADVDPWGGLTQPQVASHVPRDSVLRGVGASRDNLELPQNASSWSVFYTGDSQQDIAALSIALVTAVALKISPAAVTSPIFRWNMDYPITGNANEAFLNFTCIADGDFNGAHPELTVTTVRQLRLKYYAFGSPLDLRSAREAEELFSLDLQFWRSFRSHLLTDQNLTGQSFTEYNINNDLITIEVVEDYHWEGDLSGKSFVENELQNLQVDCWQRAADDTFISEHGDHLLDWEALLDAYVTLSMPDLLERSPVVRSALRGVPSVDSLALAVDVPSHYLANAAAPESATFIWDRLHPAWDVARTTIHSAIAEPPSVHGYLNWVLSELYDLQANAYKLAIDDEYKTHGTFTVDAGGGLLANDVDQPYRVIEVDSYSPPENGSIIVGTDGSFTFTPDSGFTGTTSFTYRSHAEIYSQPGADFVSDPATVMLKVYCLADLNEGGQVDLEDLAQLVDCSGGPGAQFTTGCASADLDGDGFVSLRDYGNFQAAFGCN